MGNNLLKYNKVVYKSHKINNRSQKFNMKLLSGKFSKMEINNILINKFPQ